MPSEVTSTHSCGSLLGGTDGYLTLRVCSREHRGRVVRLASQKCTIGAGPQCTLRLRGKGIRPLHCLILRGESGTYIRRWSPDTCLNGRGFTVARLDSGDRLHIGSIEFEVLSDGRLPPGPTRHAESDPASAAESVESSDSTSDRLEHELTQLQRQLVELQSEHQVATAECQRAGQESESVRNTMLELQQQLASRAAQNEQLTHQIQTARTRIDELEQASAAAAEEREQATQLTARFEEVKLQLETTRNELETRSQHWEEQLSERKAAVQQLRLQLEEAGKSRDQQVAERETSASRILLLEQENERLVARIAEFEHAPQPPTSDREPPADGASEWKEKAAGLQSELDKTREGHRQTLAEWQADRANLEQQLAQRRDELSRLREQHQTSMQEAEQLIHSLQQEGKQLLSQLDEAKSTIRQDAESRKQLAAAQNVPRADSGAVEQLRQTVLILEQKCAEQANELSHKTIVLQSLIESVDVPGAKKPSSTELPVGERETQDREPSPPDQDATSGPQPTSTLALGPDFRPELPEDLADVVNELPQGECPTEDRRPSMKEEQGEPAAPLKPTPTGADQDDEEHVIQNYMERLLQRVGCRPQETPAVSTRSVADAPAGKPVEKKNVSKRPQPTREPDVRNTAPEMAEHLLAMRELANRSARMAISSSDRRRVFMAASGEFSAALVSIGASSVVIAMSPEWLTVYSVGGFLGMAFGTVWLLRGLRSLLSARALRHDVDSE